VRVLFLSEGDAETFAGSFSGTSKSIVDQLRAAGDQVQTGNCDVVGWERAAAALPVFSPQRRRWASRYHLEAWPFAMRTRKARKLFDRF
jgi:hypothetical protein